MIPITKERGLMKRTIISLPDELHTQIRKLGIDYGRSMTNLIEQAVREFLVKHKPK